MNLIGFVCNFGGLLGMWLGLSLFKIFNTLVNNVECYFILPRQLLIRYALLKFKLKHYYKNYFKFLGNIRLNHSRLQIPSIFKSNTKPILKFIVMLVSLCGLIYQVQIIYDQYMSGKTIVIL